MTVRAVQIFVNDHLLCLDVFKTNDVIYFSYIGCKFVVTHSKFLLRDLIASPTHCQVCYGLADGIVSQSQHLQSAESRFRHVTITLVKKRLVQFSRLFLDPPIHYFRRGQVLVVAFDLSNESNKFCL